MGGIFLNYRTVDSGLGAVMLDEELVARFGDRAVFRDNRSIPLATKFEPVLWKRLRTSDIVIVLIGPHWLSESVNGKRLIDHPDDFVRREIAEALRLRLDVLPVLLGDAQLPKASALPRGLRQLSGCQYFAIRARDPRPDIDVLIERLGERADLAALRPPPPRTEPTPAAQPANRIRTGRIDAKTVIFGNQTRTTYYGSVRDHSGRDEDLDQD